MQRSSRVGIVLAVLAVLASCAYYQPKLPLLRGGSVDGGSNPNDDMLAPDNRGDVLVMSGEIDLTTASGRIRNIETISTRNSDGSRGNSTITLDITHVLEIAGTGFADPTDASYDRRPALHIDGDEGDSLDLVSGGNDEGWGQMVSGGTGRWLRGAGNGTNGVPAGYDLYVHVKKGTDPTDGADEYLLVQRGFAVNIP